MHAITSQAIYKPFDQCIKLWVQDFERHALELFSVPLERFPRGEGLIVEKSGRWQPKILS
jgi:hypothetical protein